MQWGQIFPSLSKENPSFFQGFPSFLQIFSLAVSNEIKGWATAPADFAFLETAAGQSPSPSRPRSANAADARSRRSAMSTTISVFPEENGAAVERAQVRKARRGERAVCAEAGASPIGAASRRGRRHSPSISRIAKIPAERGCRGRADSRSKDGPPSTPCGAPPATAKTLDSPVQSEKVRRQEIDGDLRRLGPAPSKMWVRLARLCSTTARESSRGLSGAMTRRRFHRKPPASNR